LRKINNHRKHSVSHKIDNKIKSIKDFKKEGSLKHEN
jgi:hypothetical protein